MIERKAFFDAVREKPFGGSLSQEQVDGCMLLLKEMEGSGWTDPRWTAYALATVYHETAHTMQPIEEIGRGKGRTYGQRDPETGHIYYGRGFVQLTWKDNYARMGERLGLDLVNNPDWAMQPDVSAAILIEGMQEGMFTGKKLGDYFNQSTDDPVNARRIVNGTDRAEQIAGYHRAFLSAVQAGWAPPAPQEPEQPSGDVDARLAALLARLNAQEARIASLEATREKIRNA